MQGHQPFSADLKEFGGAPSSASMHVIMSQQFPSSGASLGKKTGGSDSTQRKRLEKCRMTWHQMIKMQISRDLSKCPTRMKEMNE